jgi:hypothetical protein
MASKAIVPSALSASQRMPEPFNQSVSVPHWDSGLLFFGMNLCCIDYMAQYEEVRTLKVARFLGEEMAAETFENPATFSLAAYTRDSFGVFGPGKLQTVNVKFTGWAATNVREHQWHPSQNILKAGANVVATFGAVRPDGVPSLAAGVRPAHRGAVAEEPVG